MSEESVLDRKVYMIPEAGNLLGVHQNTLRYWLHGQRGRREAEPVLRQERRIDDKLLSWGEFIEAGHLVAYRRMEASLQQLRDYVGDWRDRQGIPYPLAHLKPYVGPARELLDHSPDGAAWRHRDGQHQIAPHAAFRSEVEFIPPGSPSREQLVSVAAFASRIDFDGDTAICYWPAGRDIGVVVDPVLKAGCPVIEGTATTTRTIYGFNKGGDSAEYLADVYDLSVGQVKEAVRFEKKLRSRQITACVAA